MGIGGSIFLIALGAIFAFAIDANLGWLDLHVVGWVLMLVGLVGLVLTLYFWNTRRRTVVAAPARDRVVTERVVPVQDERVVQEYREVRRPGGPTV